MAGHCAAYIVLCSVRWLQQAMPLDLPTQAQPASQLVPIYDWLLVEGVTASFNTLSRSLSLLSVLLSLLLLHAQAMPLDLPTQAQTASQSAPIFDWLLVEGVSDRVGNITSPTLLIAGEQDTVLPYAGMLDLFNRSACDCCELAVYSHMLS